ncbi:DUF1868 domain-containing protein [Planktothrix mougeotii]|uniref:DUF1868 domain-containing protein n=1 Tax=Planktothrix mougeotii LEGE 06226 TaxID=1828728 RepID=A0ABR9U5L3_9CYAN|nr:DUF1868 domain-containing protein [Planktothrix mougeotii]MBE9141707.1 DUF1868 domain-containing protein [Planktothrix mougeotii LEGE 06226]
MDDTYQVYVNRVARLTLPESYHSQLEYIQESPKFKPDSQGKHQAVPFPGYSIITPPAEDDGDNGEFYQNLQTCQQQLSEKFDPNFWIPIPQESLHFTLADLIWDSAYRDVSKDDPSFDPKLHEAITQSFQSFQSTPIPQGIRWQIFGFMLMPRAIAVCLVPRDQESYQKTTEFRRAIYQNPSLIPLGVDQQYYLTAHITLGYFGTIPEDLDRGHFCNILSSFNQQWLDSTQEIWVKRAELRKFDDMTRYYREPDWPVFKF